MSPSGRPPGGAGPPASNVSSAASDVTSRRNAWCRPGASHRGNEPPPRPLEEFFPELVVRPPGLHQLPVAALLQHPALANHSDVVGLLHRLQPMGDDQPGGGGARTQSLEDLGTDGDVTTRAAGWCLRYVIVTVQKYCS